MIREDITNMTVLMERVRNIVRESSSSRSFVYKDISPVLITHDIFKAKHNINECYRLAFTRFNVWSYFSGRDWTVEQAWAWPPTT